MSLSPMTKKGNNKTASNDLTLFFKKLRKLGEKFKYYAVGEYGSKTMRPHYHVLFFGINDKNCIFKAWKLGNIHIGDVTSASISYTLKYMDKIKKIPMYEGDMRVKEFSRSSQNLGLGFLNNDNVKNYFKEDITRNFVFTDQGHKVPIPSYYKNKLWTEEQRKQQRRYIDRECRDQESKARKAHKDKRYTYDEKEDLKQIAEWNKYIYQIKKRDKL